MKKRNTSADLDARIDALLRARPAAPSASFTGDTLARIRAVPEISDERLDELLAEMPAAVRGDFTSRTLARVSRRGNFVYFLRPVLAAAASVALCLTGIRAWDAPAPAPVAAVQNDDMSEILELARSLDEAAPLLDEKSAATLTLLMGPK